MAEAIATLVVAALAAFWWLATELATVKTLVLEIRDNHLAHIYAALEKLEDRNG